MVANAVLPSLSQAVYRSLATAGKGLPQD